MSTLNEFLEKALKDYRPKVNEAKIYDLSKIEKEWKKILDFLGDESGDLDNQYKNLMVKVMLKMKKMK
jgi:hypothetical protein